MGGIMKKLMLSFGLILCLLLVLSCATTRVVYEESFLGIDKGGEVNILLSRAVPQLTIIMDDKILLDARGFGTRRVDIKNVPKGEHSIKMFANSWQLKENFKYEGVTTVKTGKDFPIMIDVPQYSTMYWIYIIGIAIVSALPSVVVSY